MMYEKMLEEMKEDMENLEKNEYYCLNCMEVIQEFTDRDDEHKKFQEDHTTIYWWHEQDRVISFSSLIDILDKIVEGEV